MDSKQLNQLDPKLKETYERVMGTGIKTTPVAPMKPFQTFQQPTKQPIQPFKPIQPQPAQVIQRQPIQRPQTQNIKKNNKILPVFLALAGIVFLIGYAFFWIKFFKLKLPFLPF